MVRYVCTFKISHLNLNWVHDNCIKMIFTEKGSLIALTSDVIIHSQLKVVSTDDPKSLWASAPDAHAGMATALYSTGNDIVYSGGK